MRTVTVSLAEKRILEHLRLGGTVADEVGRQLVWKFAEKMWTEPQVRPLLREHEITIQELATLYAAVIDDLMPNPTIEAGGPLLVPTLFFMEPHRLANLLVEVRRETRGQSSEERFGELLERAKYLAKLTQEAHDEARGPHACQRPVKTEGI